MRPSAVYQNPVKIEDYTQFAVARYHGAAHPSPVSIAKSTQAVSYDGRPNHKVPHRIGLRRQVKKNMTIDCRDVASVLISQVRIEDLTIGEPI